MQLPKVLLAAVLCVGPLSHASALTIDLGTIDNSVDTFGSLVGKGSFSDTFKFALGGVSDITGYFVETLISPLAINLKGPAGFSYSTSAGGIVNAGTYSFSNLAPGAYTLGLSGYGMTRFLSGYGIGYTVTTAVPELDTWLMLVLGAGLIALQLRRKQKALQPQVLTS